MSSTTTLRARPACCPYARICGVFRTERVRATAARGLGAAVWGGTPPGPGDVMATYVPMMNVWLPLLDSVTLEPPVLVQVMSAVSDEPF